MADPVDPPWRALLIGLGVAFLAAGLLWPLLSRFVGSLPGDVVVRRGGWTIAFPIVTCLILSLIVSLILWLLRR